MGVLEVEVEFKEDEHVVLNVQPKKRDFLSKKKKKIENYPETKMIPKRKYIT